VNTDATWQNADAVFGELMRVPPTVRPARLAAMDLPEAVRARVERMLQAFHDDASGILDEPRTMTAALQVGALAGRRLGRWRLQGEIGRGGMAVVYRAVSVEAPEGQAAAVKVLTMGTLAGSGSRQFLQEQASLLRLRHPYIVPLLDAGVAGDGTPWLAMALVRGERIDAWCERQALGQRARIVLALQVCEAVAHAHRNLVIHRDIKPSNVLVDEDGRVRLLDFGIARPMDGVADPTVTGMRALTPGYAAPEQRAGEPPTTGMDVYGLGALLYRLLTGGVPKPGHARPPRGDLGLITMKALAERAEQRYPSVEALADDLGRWLDGKPVRARRPSLRYRLGKFAARNKLLVASAAVLLLVLVGGVTATLWQAGIAREEAMRARQAAAGSEAQLAYLRSVLEVLAPATPETASLDRHQVVAEAALRASRDLADRPALLASARLSLGDIAQRIGDYPLAHALFDEAATARRELFGADSGEYGEALALLGSSTAHVDPADPQLAETRLAEAVRLLEAHRPGSAALAGALARHAAALADLDRMDQAATRLERAAALCRDEASAVESCDEVWLARGQLLVRRGRAADAIVPFRQLLAWRGDRLGDTHSATAFARGLLGYAHSLDGDHERGIALLTEADRALRDANRRPTAQTLMTLQHLGEALVRANRVEEAVEIHQRCIEQAGVLFGENSEELALALSQYGGVLMQQGRYREAAAGYARSHAIYRALYGPRSAAAAITLGNHADALGESGDLVQALELAREALAGYRESLGDAHPRTGVMWGKFGDELLANGLAQEALAAYDSGAAALGQAAGRMERQALAVVRAKRALALSALRRVPEALRDAREAEAELQRLTGGEGVHHGLALASLVQVACQVRAHDCGALRERARRALEDPAQPADRRLRLERALAAVSPGPAA